MRQLDPRNTTTISGAHTEAVEFVAWNPTHPELFCSSSSKDKRVAFYDARREFRSPTVFAPFLLLFLQLVASSSESRPTQVINTSRHPINLQYSPDAKTIMVLDDDDRLSFIKHGNTGSDGHLEWKTGETARVPGYGSVSSYDHTTRVPSSLLTLR
jgi:THO complex subunit 3